MSIKQLHFSVLCLWIIFFCCVQCYGKDKLVLSPAKLTMFVDELPCMPKITAFHVDNGVMEASNITIGMYQKTWKFHRDLPPTQVFAFGTSEDTAAVPGPTIEAMQDIPTHITWENHLPNHHILSIDPTIPIANPKHGGIPTVVHLHGGVHPPDSDGNPEAWYTSSYNSTGPSFVSSTSFYPNVQDPGNLWYHDHAMGLTRINLLAGLLGSYSIHNPSIEKKFNLPSGDTFDRHIAIFDRSFATDGSLFLNTTGNNPSIHPQWQPEYFGDAIIVNGRIWPYLKVTRRRYRFRIINASNARYYRLFFPNGLKFMHVGSDSTYLCELVMSTSFLLAPSEIADVVVDFSESKTDSVVLQNDAVYPYPSGDPTDQYNGKVMKFIIDNKNTTTENPGKQIPKQLIKYPKPAVQRAKATRYITMYEYTTPAGGVTHLLLNNKTYDDPVTETPKSGTSEIWYIINLTNDNHPLHIHLGLFTVLEQRELLDLNVFKDCMDKNNDAKLCGVEKHAKGKSALVPEYERGWKNVFKMMPGYVTKIFLKFSVLKADGDEKYPFNVAGKPGYVYHCHILEHEDNVMMRPMILIP